MDKLKCTPIVIDRSIIQTGYISLVVEAQRRQLSVVASDGLLADQSEDTTATPHDCIPQAIGREPLNKRENRSEDEWENGYYSGCDSNDDDLISLDYEGNSLTDHDSDTTQRAKRTEGSHSLSPVELPTIMEQTLDDLVAAQPAKRLRQDIKALRNHLGTRIATTSASYFHVKEERQKDHLREVEEAIRVHGMSKSQAQKAVHIARLRASMVKKKGMKGPPCDREVEPPLPHTFTYKSREGLAYAVSCMPEIYATTVRVFQEIADRVPNWDPKSMIDFGSGTASAVWAAHKVWGGVTSHECIDISQHMIDLADNLLRDKNDKLVIPNITFRQFLSVNQNSTPSNLVTAAFALCELPDENTRRNSLWSLWQRTEDFLVLIEPASKDGFANILEARDMMLRMDKAHVVAPCPHSYKCPRIGTQRTCAFAQRAKLTPSQLLLMASDKAKRDSFDIQSFSYLVVAKGEMADLLSKDPKGDWGRIMSPPLKRGSHIIMNVCQNGEIVKVIRTRGQSKLMYQDL
eukprot:Ihof_evm2s127 gene=Ihof_evmTU2s127